MVDKTEAIDSIAQKSSEELFLRGSEKDEMLRKRTDDAELKLDDSQEELSLQNIQRGSEQRDQSVATAEKQGAAAERAETSGLQSESDEPAAQVSRAENVVTDQSENKQTYYETTDSGAGNNAGGAGREVVGNDDSDQDARRVLFNSETREENQSQTLFTDEEKPPVTNTNEVVNETPDADDIDINISSINVAPEAGDAVHVNVNEGAPVLNEQLLATDINLGTELSYQLVDGIDIPEGFTLSIDGNWKFDAQDSAYDYLDPGDSVVFTVPVVVSNEYGASDTTQIQITVYGTNDAPVAGAEVTASVDEGSAVISGQLTSTDVDDGAIASFSVSEGVGSPEGFVLNADGSYSFDPANSAYNNLNVGDSTVLTIPVTVTDDNGATDATQIQITLQGTNDAPVAGVEVTASVDEGSAVIYGQLTSTDVDDGATASFSVSEGVGSPEGFVLNADGSYSFDPANSAYNNLNVGDSTVLTIPVTVTDDNGATDATQIQVTVYGTNDAPVAGAEVTALVDEGSAVISGQLTSTDVDDGAIASFSVSEGVSAPEGFVLNADGSYSFDPADSAYDYLNVGDSAVLTVPVTVTDDNGATDATQIQITLQGTNDAPVAGVEVTASVDEGSAVIYGQLTSTDVDDGATASFSVSEGDSAPEGFVLNADGSYSFDPADGSYDYLNVGDSEVLTIPVTVTDDQGATDTTQVKITVFGSNGVPTAVDDATEGFIPANASLITELAFDEGVPTAMLGSVTAEGNGQVGSAADFSGAKVEASGLNLNGEAGAQTTVSMWVKANPEGGWEMLAASNRYDMVMLNGDIGFNTARGDMFGTDASELSDGQWHQVVGVFTNGDVTQNTIYIDGVEQQMSQIRGTPNNASANIDSSGGSLYFGSWGANNNYRFTGSMDEIKVFDGALSSAEVSSLYDLEADNVKWNGGTLSTQEDSVLTINPSELLANDTDPDGDILSISAVQDGNNGTVEIDADGNIVFTPDENYNGEASFSYTVSDGNGGESTATVTLNVSSVNDLPTIDVVNTITVNEDGSQQFTYSTVDIDSSNVVVTGNAENGNVVVNDNGTVTFTPNENYFGDDTIVLTATDSNGGITTREISVSVNPIEDAPDAVNDGNFEPQSATLTTELSFDAGVPGAMLGTVTTSAGQLGDAANFNSAKVEVSGLALNGSAGAQTTVSMWVKANPEGGWEMLAASNRYDMVMLNGDIGFNTARGDMFGTDASELADGQWHQVVGVFTNGDVTQNTIYIDGVEQQMSQIRGTPNNASANIDSSGGNLYFGSWGANNNYRFTGSMDEVKVFDGALSSEEVNALYDMESSNIKWDGTSLSTDEDVSLVIDPSRLLANDTDVDGDVLSIVSVQDAQNGTVEIDGDGNIVFSPDANYNGEATFTYTIDDGNGNTDTATATLNVERVSDNIIAGEGNDTYVVSPFDDGDYFSGGEGGGWVDAIDISAVVANDPDNPWTIEVDGSQVEYQLAEGALALEPDSAGVISFGDGSEITFAGVERIEW